MTNTSNFNFVKPAGSDYYNVEDQNGNWDIADEVLKEHDSAIDAENTECEVSIGATWQGTSAPYTQTVSLPEGYRFVEKARQVLRANTVSTLSSSAIALNTKYAAMITDWTLDTETGEISLVCGIKKPGAAFSVRISGVEAEL